MQGHRLHGPQAHSGTALDSHSLSLTQHSPLLQSNSLFSGSGHALCIKECNALTVTAS